MRFLALILAVACDSGVVHVRPGAPDTDVPVGDTDVAPADDTDAPVESDNQVDTDTGEEHTGERSWPALRESDLPDVSSCDIVDGWSDWTISAIVPDVPATIKARGLLEVQLVAWARGPHGCAEPLADGEPLLTTTDTGGFIDASFTTWADCSARIDVAWIAVTDVGTHIYAASTDPTELTLCP